MDVDEMVERCLLDDNLDDILDDKSDDNLDDNLPRVPQFQRWWTKQVADQMDECMSEELYLSLLAR